MDDLRILKIGGSLFACKESDVPKTDDATLARLAREIADALSVKEGRFGLVIVHGAGSWGHSIVRASGIDKGIRSGKDRLAFARTQILQNSLNAVFTGALADAGVPAFPIQMSAHAETDDGVLVSATLDAIRSLLDLGMVPVAYGVPVCDRTRGCSILSGDQIGPYFARELGARTLIHATDVDGVFTADPKKDVSARLVPKITAANLDSIRHGLAGSIHTDVTGGMVRKIEEIAEMAGAGIESVIINGLRPGNIRDALLGQVEVGTTVEI